MSDLASPAAVEEFRRERDRCVDRLRGMPLTRLPASADLAYGAACALLALTPDTAGHALPRLADHAAGDQLAVVADDFLASHPDDEGLARAAAALTTLRRSLP